MDRHVRSPRRTRRQPAPCVCLLPLTLLAASLTAAAAFASDAGDRPAPSHEVFNQLDARVKDMQAALDSSYGHDARLSDLPREIGNEVDAVISKHRDLSNEARDLDDRWSTLAADERHRKFDQDVLDSKFRDLDREEKVLKDLVADFNRRAAALERECEDHNNRYGLIDDRNQAAVSAYNAEKARLEARQDTLRREKQDLDARQQSVQDRRQKLIEGAAADLKKTVGILAKKRGVLNRDMIAFMGRCQAILPRAAACAQILREPPSQRTQHVEAYKSQAEMNDEIVQSVVKNVALEGFKNAICDTELPGLAITAAEVATTGVDARTREVERDILLIGDYGRALQRLKAEGRLKKDDPGYQALRQMLIDRKEKLPRDGTDIVLQGLGSVEAMTHILAEAAGHYVSGKVETRGTWIMKQLSKGDQKVLGEGGRKFFEGTLNSVIVGGAKSSETVARQGAESVRSIFNQVYENKPAADDSP